MRYGNGKDLGAIMVDLTLVRRPYDNHLLVMLSLWFLGVCIDHLKLIHVNYFENNLLSHSKQAVSRNPFFCELFLSFRRRTIDFFGKYPEALRTACPLMRGHIPEGRIPQPHLRTSQNSHCVTIKMSDLLLLIRTIITDDSKHDATL
jgi:hypothetical protein